MKRRTFIAGLSAAAAWPALARAQQGERMRHVGVLSAAAEDDPETKMQIAAFQQRLGQLGWLEERNIHIDYRYAAGTGDQLVKYAAQLARLKPDVLVVNGPAGVKALQRENLDIPIVFATISDPVGLGLVDSLARPGGNVTGFTLFDRSVAGKLLETLKEAVPNLARAALITDPENPASPGHVTSFENAARSLAVAPSVFRARNGTDIERAFGTFGQAPNSGLVFSPEVMSRNNQGLILELAARDHLPAVYGDRSWVTNGGLISYGIDMLDNWRGSASYVDRILRGERPADLPVQQPAKFQFAVNLKTAKALGITFPLSIMLRADEVIE